MASPLRLPLLWLAQQRRVGDVLERLPPARRLVRRFVAGFNHETALATAATLRAEGFAVTLSYLGEDVTSGDEAGAATDEYLRLIEAAAPADRGAVTVAVKPTLLGLNLSEAIGAGNLARIAEAAERAGVRLELDMERSTTVDATLALYEGIAARPHTGVALQAYLRRTAADLDMLIGRGIARVRLVKGAYDEPASVAFQSRDEIARSYHALVRDAFAPASIAEGTRLALATHDLALIAASRTRAHRRRVPDDRWEVQMLFGVRAQLQRQLLREGYRVRVYLPYGAHWYPYFLRRLAERPANIGFAVRSLFSS